jgi:gliding motility-associated-like protein
MAKIYKKLVFAVFFFPCSFVFSQTTAIPDAEFERQLIAFGYDSDPVINGSILNSEAEAVTELITNGDGITNFEGLEAFKNIKKVNLGRNQFTTLPLENLTALEELSFKDNVILVSLDLSKNIKLKNLDIRSIQAINTSLITTLDLSANIQLEYIHVFNFQDLETIMLPRTKNLAYLFITLNFDLLADMSFYDNLETLDLSVSGGKLITLTLPAVKTNFKSIRIANGNVSDFRGLADFVNIEEIRLYTITEFIELPKSNTLNYIHIGPHSISTPLSFDEIPSLSYLDLVGNRLETPFEIDIRTNSELETLILAANKMVNLNLEGNPNLRELKIQENNLEELDVSKNINLETVWAYRNLLNNLDLRNNLKLINLNLNENRLKSLDISENRVLQNLDISKNLFAGEGPDLNQNTELVNLNMSNNKISSLDITACLKLVNTNLSFNKLSGNNILEQIVQNYQTAGKSLGQETYILNDNLLSNTIPDFTSIVDASTKNFSISIHNNSFHFGDLEARHQQYVNYANTPRGDGFIFKKYSYAGQSKVNVREVITTIAGDPITLATVVRGSQNHYKWFKDGVEIVGAADAPEYTIPAPEACESGVYYAEITSDLVPFEDANDPGTNGKNLLLQRNDIVLGANGIPTCAILVKPLNKAIDIPINAGIEWESESGACGYLLNVGSAPGLTDILNNKDVGNVSGYNFENNLPSNAEVFVTITPYFENGPLLGCREESFTTNSESTLPECSVLTQPLSGSVGVNVDTNINWSVASGAEGYRIEIGTTSGANDLGAEVVDDGSTTFDPSVDFILNTEIFVTITPYNSEGDALGCAESSFVISEADEIPPCTSLSRPLNGDTNVKTNTIIRWNRVGNANGYELNIGTSEFGSELLSRDVGSEIEFQFESNLPDAETIYVTIIPYNTRGIAIACISERFITAALKPLPECTTLIAPINGERNVDPFVNLVWNIAENAEGYLLEVGTTPEGDEFFSEDVGLTTFYNFRNDLPEGQPIYVKITPYNERGEAIECSRESFVTNVPTIPDCTTLVVPMNEDTEVSVATNFAWTAATTAKGYRLMIGTTSGGNDILSEDVGATTFFDLPNSLPAQTIIYATVIPYNDAGEALSCQEENFTTSGAVIKPDCTQFLVPNDNDTNVSVLTDFAWQAIDNADGYTLQIGTSSGVAVLFDGEVIASNSFNYEGILPENTAIYMTVVPFNEAGSATAVCEEIRFTTTAAPSIPECATLIMPMSEATGISIETNLAWSSIFNAEGYLLNIGTSSGANDVFSADVGRATWYDLPNDLPENSLIYIAIIAYNELGMAMNCLEEQFETTSEPSIPTCTGILIPKNQEENVNVSSNIAWGLVSNADGYKLNVGTTSQGTELFSGDVGSTTFFDLNADLPENTLVYVSITPYNDLGESLNCIEDTFRTAQVSTIPSCTILTNPVNGSRAVNPNLALSWSTIADVTGYRLSVGTSPDVYDIINDLDVGDVNQYDFEGPLPLGVQIYVDIRPYNDFGTNTSCAPELFTTAITELEPVPFCTDIYEPINGQSNISLTTDIRWNEILNVEGYLLSLGTTEGATDILDQFDVGNVTTYEISNLPAASVIYASVNAYNAQGAPEGCSYSTFITVFDEVNVNDTKFGLTPNGDGLNDFWRIDGIEAHPENIVRIFNRWGDEVFKVSGYNNLTNAFAGEANRMTGSGAGQLPSGTYFFDIRIDGDHDIEKLRGYLILKR